LPARYRDTKTATLYSDYFEAAKFGDVFFEWQTGFGCDAGKWLMRSKAAQSPT